MRSQQRKEREREERRRLIISTARELAEAEGWEAVTTRKLADRVEYSQPVLYSHFKNMDALAAAVAIEGFDELATELHKVRTAAGSAISGLRELARCYLAFAEEQPALYEAMFVRRTDLRFATGETPESLRAAFAEFQAAVTPFAKPGTEPETLAELFWSSLHGQATLGSSTRLRPSHQQDRLDLLIDLVVGRQGWRGEKS